MNQSWIRTGALFALLLVTSCKSKENPTMILSDTQEARLPLSHEPESLDPRRTKGLAASNVAYMLFEGLTRVDSYGKVVPGVAETINVSPDMKTYTFVLKDTKWSNGDPLTAYDFEYSWKTQLQPENHFPSEYMLSVIRGVDGVQAVDDKTLVVHLENPTPYFLQLVATAPFFPVSKKWYEEHPDMKENENLTVVGNGPFALVSYIPQVGIELKKNDFYWSMPSVKLSKLFIPFYDDHTSFSLYEKGELDWAGAPLTVLPQTALESLKQNNRLNAPAAAGTQFLRVNVAKAPFSNAKMRRAFCLAIDSQNVIDSCMQGDQKQATSFVPPALGLTAKPSFIPHDLTAAKALFEDALQEEQFTRETLPEITLSFIDSERSQKMYNAIKQNFKDAFDIDIMLQPLPAEAYYRAVFAKDYSLAAGSWFADYFDPMSFLSIFQYQDNGTNNTGWSNSNYTHLLERSCFEMDHEKRIELLAQAEDILMQEMPILPIFHFSFPYAKQETLQGVSPSPMGIVALDEAFKTKGS